MTEGDIIETLRAKLAMPGGRHLYGVLGAYPMLDHFATTLQRGTTPDGRPFPAPLSVNRGILEAIPDQEFQTLVKDEAKRPEPTARHVGIAFEHFLRDALRSHDMLVLAHLEMLWAYNLELNLLRTLAADDNRILLLLPGRRVQGKIVMFPDLTEGSYTLPSNLIAENHLWELTD